MTPGLDERDAILSRLRDCRMDPRPVEVLHDGRWLPGWLLAARRNPDGSWRGLVRYTESPEMQ